MRSQALYRHSCFHIEDALIIPLFRVLSRCDFEYVLFANLGEIPRDALCRYLNSNNSELPRFCLKIFTRCYQSVQACIDGSTELSVVLEMTSAGDFRTKNTACAAVLQLTEMCHLDSLGGLIDHCVTEIPCEFSKSELPVQCMNSISDLISKFMVISNSDDDHIWN